MFPHDLTTKIEHKWPRKCLCSGSKSPVWGTPDGMPADARQMSKPCCSLSPSHLQGIYSSQYSNGSSCAPLRGESFKTTACPTRTSNAACTIHETGRNCLHGSSQIPLVPFDTEVSPTSKCSGAPSDEPVISSDIEMRRHVRLRRLIVSSKIWGEDHICDGIQG